MKFVINTRALLIGLWLGAACFFSFAVAPSAFGVLPSRELAGNVVSRTLMIVNLSGIVIGVILIVSTLIKRLDLKAIWLWIERLLLLVVVAACAAGQFVISSWLSVVRAQAGKPMEEVALDDPLKIQFDQLHQYSVWMLMTAMIAGLIVYFIISSKTGGASAKSTSKDFDFQSDFIN